MSDTEPSATGAIGKELKFKSAKLDVNPDQLKVVRLDSKEEVIIQDASIKA